MKKKSISPGAGRQLLYSATATMVTCKDGDKENIITITYVAPVATKPIQAMISVNKKRYSYDMIKNSGDFVINIPGPDLAFETQYCGRRSGAKYDKFKEMKLTAVPSQAVHSPLIEECWAHVECKIVQIVDVGSHSIFIGEIVAASVAEGYYDEGRVMLDGGPARILQFLGGRHYGVLEKSFEVPLDRDEEQNEL